MPAADNPRPATVAAVRAHLLAVAQLLREVPPLTPEAQHSLAELVAQLAAALEGDRDEAAEGVEDAGAEGETILGRARGRLEEAAVAFESEAPGVAGATRQLIDTLANLGI